MLKLPGDEFVSIELARDASRNGIEFGSGLNHFVIKIESMAAMIAELAIEGIAVETPTSTG